VADAIGVLWQVWSALNQRSVGCSSQ